ncbi:MAG: sigma-54-dependent Fis family transcriptional regulator [Gemmatimonadaceae bacterium]|nr:sigma-54-dependent Fis family transcriptional regulator [Gemmatimonadaceae bacterium]
MTLSVLVVDDDESIRTTLVEFFVSLGHTVRGAGTASEGRRLAQEHAPDVVLLDLRLPDANGLVAMTAFKADDPDVAVILLTGFADVRTAVQAMHEGASDVLEKPIDLQTLAAAVLRSAEPGRLRQEVSILRAQSRPPSGVSDPTVFDPTIEQLVELAARNSDAPVLLQGETGTGKGHIARLIHDRSSKNALPFIEINCASLSSTFFESELFGHERGAFTDARAAKRGLLEIAGDGSIFLDEVAEMAPDVQPRFLKVLEDRTFRRLGGTTVLHAGARIIVATNQPLPQAVANGRFRADLFYRLQVLTLTVPPLRERVGDILPLARAFLPRGARLGQSAEDILRRYDWPGNVRELKNTIWRAAILADGAEIHSGHLGLFVSEPLPAPEPLSQREMASESMRDVERGAIRHALSVTGGNRSKAALRLGIARSTLLEKIKRFGL